MLVQSWYSWLAHLISRLHSSRKYVTAGIEIPVSRRSLKEASCMYLQNQWKRWIIPKSQHQDFNISLTCCRHRPCPEGHTRARLTRGRGSMSSSIRIPRREAPRWRECLRCCGWSESPPRHSESSGLRPGMMRIFTNEHCDEHDSSMTQYICFLCFRR